MANTFGVSTLSRAPGSIAGDLHHEYQMRGSTFSGDRMVRTVQFSGPKFNDENSVQLNTLAMAVERMMLRFEVKYDSADSSMDANIKLEPTQTWATSVRFGQQENIMYSCQEEELLTYMYDNPNSAQDQIDQLIAHNDWGYTPAGFAGKQSPDVSTVTRGTKSFFLDLAPISDKIMSKIGSLDAHQPKSLFLTVNLKDSMKLLSSENGTPAMPTQSLEIMKMELVLIGHREDRAAVKSYQEALLRGGIRFALEQPNYAKETFATNTTDQTISAPSISGDVTYFSILLRDYDAWNESSDPENSRNIKWVEESIINNPRSTLDIGTPESESELFGKSMPLRVLMSTYKGRSIIGSSRFYGPEGLRYIAKIPVPLGMDTSAGQVDGVWSGGFRVQNNLQLRFRFQGGTSASYATLVNVIVYVRRIIVMGAYAFTSATE